MVEWAAANVTHHDEDEGSYSDMESGSGSDIDADLNANEGQQQVDRKRKRKRRRGQGRGKRSRRASETPEAALARLTSSYSRAMAKVGALHRKSIKFKKMMKRMEERKETSKEPEPTGKAVADADSGSGVNIMAVFQSLKDEAREARGLFEDKLLSDALLAPFAPTFGKLYSRFSRNSDDDNGGDNGDDDEDGGKEKVKKMTTRVSDLASIPAAHRATLKELAYASLVNYADLLICACTCSSSDTRDEVDIGMDILDRGAVNVLDALICQDSTNQLQLPMPSTRSLWIDHDESKNDKDDESDKLNEKTRRLALVSYCDAADLEGGTDPTLWFKLACAARSLGRVLREREILASSKSKNHDAGDMSMDVDAGADVDLGVDTTSSTQMPSTKFQNLSYERMERYALERGVQALNHGIPPNRSIMRAYREMEQRQIILGNANAYDVDVIPDLKIGTTTTTSTADLIIDLPRYSWSTLGRYLVRACRDGVMVEDERTGWTLVQGAGDGSDVPVVSPTHASLSPSSSSSLSPQYLHEGRNMFGSPCIQIKISPLLSLPSEALVNVCALVGTDGVKALESTCRSLSVEIISSRALIEKGHVDRMKQMELEMGDMLEKEKEREIEKEKESQQKQEQKPNSDREKEQQVSIGKVGEEEEAQQRRKLMKYAHRSSKRVRTQLITSGKQAERSAKRKSVAYCLIRSIIPCCTMEHPVYLYLFNKDLEQIWDELLPLRPYAERTGVMLRSMMPTYHKSGDVTGTSRPMDNNNHDVTKEKLFNTKNHYVGKSSLNGFIKRWSRFNSGPRDMLYRYLAHISCFVDEIYHYETGAMMLSQCINDCFDVLLPGAEDQDSFTPSWYGEETFIPEKHSLSHAIEIFAVNLLSAELSMRTCERHVIKIQSFNDNLQTVRTNLPHLLHYSEALDKYGVGMDISTSLRLMLAKLQTRTYWLAGVFYDWYSRNTPIESDIKEIESLSLHFIDKTMASLQTPALNSVSSVSTAHLVSPGRVGSHWTELSVENVKAYRDQIELSTVISRVRQTFCDLVRDQNKSANTGEIQVAIGDLKGDDEVKILSIRNDLFERYGLTGDGLGQNFDEIINDFVDKHGSTLIKCSTIMGGANDLDSKDASEKWSSVWHAIPTESSSPVQVDVPSLLTIVVFCYQHDKNNFREHLGRLLNRLILVTLEKRIRAIEQRDVSNIDLTLDDDGDNSSDDSSVDNETSSCDPLRLMRLAHYLMAKFRVLFPDVISNDNQKIDVFCTLKASIESSAGISSRVGITSKTSILLQPDVDMLISALSLAVVYMNSFDKGGDGYKDVEASLFMVLMRLIVHCKKSMISLMKGDNHIGRAHCHRLIILWTKYVSRVATELGGLFSMHKNIYTTDGDIKGSNLITNVIAADGKNNKSGEIATFLQMTESLSWFWRFVSTAEKIETSTQAKYNRITNSVHKSAARDLLVPIAGTIIALCGSVGHGDKSAISKVFYAVENQRSNIDKDAMSSSEYFESDDSAREWTDEGDEEDVKTRKSVLRTLSRTVQCIGLVFSSHSDEDLSSDLTCIISPIHGGYFLPLITVRVLTNISDFVLLEFNEENDQEQTRKPIWDDEHPFGFRRVGFQLDLLLHRAYRCLHGICISSPHIQNMVDKDAAIPTPVSSPSTNNKCFRPESTQAAIQLYRCVKRAYSNGRRNIPSYIFDCISSSLPPARESERVQAIKKFIFCGNQDVPSDFSGESPESISLTTEIIDDLPSDFPLDLFVTHSIDDHTSVVKKTSHEASSILEDDIEVVRQGMCEYLVDSPIPTIASNSQFDAGNQSASGQLEHALAAAKSEIACSKKISAIAKALHYNPKDENKWYQAGLCFETKLNLILDRLIPGNSGYKSDQFYLASFSTLAERDSCWKVKRGRQYDFDTLTKKQIHRYEKEMSRRIALTQTDQSMIMDCQWCNFDSLVAFEEAFLKAVLVEESIPSTSKDKDFLLSLRTSFRHGNYSQWRRHWGIIFVNTLRIMRHKCFCIAMYLSKKREVSGEDSIYSTVAEASGTAYYDAIGFSTAHQTKFEKRRKAKLAKKCFESALESLRATTKTDSDKVLATWEINFMIGKCFEKIANSIDREKFKVVGQDGEEARTYEVLMHKALENYSSSLVEAKAFADEGAHLEFQGGGSSHGLIEMVYRLHATRLKVLLYAVKTPKRYIQAAIHEALRLTEKHWFEEPIEGLGEGSINDRLWSVLCDVVNGLIYCRKEQPYFHRSVYRHAQALLWAPLFHDPNGAVNGSKSVIPSHKCSQLQGLDNGPCINSAEPVISQLFDKKRSQLCAVWVTTPASPTPFEAINNTGRKYDRMRCKYIGAFIECMLLCRRHDPLEMFLKYTQGTVRDLPAFYDLSARPNLLSPVQHHSKDNLLLPGLGLIFFAKKYANAAISNILVEKLSGMEHGKSDMNENMKTEIYLSIYKCFSRLNCSTSDNLWLSQKLRQRFESGLIPEADAICHAYKTLYIGDQGVGPEATSSFNQMSWEEKMGTLQYAVNKGFQISTTVSSDVDANKQVRRKRKAFYEEDNSH